MSKRLIDLPRQLVITSIFFGLLVVTWLSFATVQITHGLEQQRYEATRLLQLRAIAGKIELEYIRHQPASLVSLVRQQNIDGGWAYLLVCAPTGEAIEQLAGDPLVLSHVKTSTNYSCTSSIMAVDSDAGVTSCRFALNDGRYLREHRLKLQVRHESIGEIRAALIEPDLSQSALAALSYAPWFMSGAIGLVGLGALVLSRLLKPIGAIDQQLADIALAADDAELDPQPIQLRSITTVGWNRWLSHYRMLQNEGRRPNLDQTLQQTIERRKQLGMERILDALPEGIALTDANGQIKFANQAMVGLLGIGSIQELIGQSLLQHLTGDSISDLTDLPQRRRSIVIEAAAKRCSDRVLRIGWHPTTAPGGIWSIRDITQQKLADQMRSQFMDAATHELRTPLANIKAYAETISLTDDLDVEQQKEFCNIINAEATRLARFVDDMLAVSSIEVGSLTITRQSVDTSRFFSEVIDKVRQLIESKSLTLDVTLPEKFPEVTWDKDKVSVMLVNLLSNAAKYTPSQGKVSLRVTTVQRNLQIRVEDTGVGITADELPKIFDKFFRSTDPRVHAQQGTGLGLTLAREVARLHGGDITVQSELNKGSAFTVTLPL